MESALRILHIVDCMNHSGIPTLLMNMYRNIDRKKIQFDFLTTKEGAFDEEIKNMGGHLYYIPSLDKSGYFMYKRSLKSFFKRHASYIIVHSHIDQLSAIALREARRVRIPVRIAHSYNTAIEGSIITKLWKSVIGLFVPVHATDYFACSTESADWLFKWKAKQAEFFQHALDLEKFLYSASTRKVYRDKLGLTEDHFLIGHVGGYTAQKNHTFLLDCFRALRRKIPQAKLALIGDGPLKKQIEEKIIQYRLQEHILILGEKEDVENWMQSFDLYIFPSLHEGFPVSVLEAQCAGLPVLVSDTITKEIHLGSGQVHFLPLEDKKVWVVEMERLYELKPRIPIERAGLLKEGFNVNEIAKQTEEKYCYLRDEGI
ncbi:Glycosyltransferase involved in cell wall bisynthesis [Gracilibacillus ureilyticus]|uniref:Glycosyltransferase involved in cell wall bisynthesis n=1 Tax=Gracilibacillus ureilyticus TaxID=531814 RepID=A0A1H9PJX4_9BACI|nr:glycosyltransferase [Gracilibacillus ureilyticus]SER48541.1 Glycosyltransferase involved in cell wall bisynthesis [Gracilibacillus ureilyticus]